MSTKIYASQDWVEEKLSSEEMSEEDMTDFLIEVGAIQPLSNSAGAIYTNSANQMYIL